MTLPEAIERALRTTLTRRGVSMSTFARRLGSGKESARKKLKTVGNAALRLAEICEAAGSDAVEVLQLARHIQSEESADAVKIAARGADE